MSDLNLYEVACSVTFYIEVEAENEEDAKDQAESSLRERGLYDLSVSTSPIVTESINKAGY